MDAIVLLTVEAIIVPPAIFFLFILVKVRMPYIFTLLMHKQFVRIRTKSAGELLKTFKVVPQGIRYKVGKINYTLNVDTDEVSNFYGKQIVDVGFPSGLPLNLAIAMKMDSARLERAILDEARLRYSNMYERLNSEALAFKDSKLKPSFTEEEKNTIIDYYKTEIRHQITSLDIDWTKDEPNDVMTAPESTSNDDLKRFTYFYAEVKEAIKGEQLNLNKFWNYWDRHANQSTKQAEIEVAKLEGLSLKGKSQDDLIKYAVVVLILAMAAVVLLVGLGLI